MGQGGGHTPAGARCTERSWLSSDNMCVSVEQCVEPAQEKGNRLSGRQWNPVDEWSRCRRDGELENKGAVQNTYPNYAVE